MNQEIDFWEGEVHAYTEALANAKAQLRQAQLDDCPIKIGDLVKHRREDAVYRVCDIDLSVYPTVWLKGNLRKPDGVTFGARVRQLFSDWQTLPSG